MAGGTMSANSSEVRAIDRLWVPGPAIPFFSLKSLAGSPRMRVVASLRVVDTWSPRCFAKSVPWGPVNSVLLSFSSAASYLLMEQS